MPAILLAIAAFPLTLAEIAFAAMSFSPQPFAQAMVSREVQTAAFIIVFLAGVSEMLGQSVVLVINRVPLYRFLASLALTGFTYVFTAFAWGLATLIAAPFTPVGPLALQDFLPVTAVLSLAFAPRLFGVFSIAPYFGGPLGNLLEIWAMALAMFGLHTALELPVAAAVLCSGLGWLLAFILRAFVGHLLSRPLARLRTAITGSTLEKTPARLLDDIFQQLAGATRQS